MTLFLVTVKRDFNQQGAGFLKNMSVEVQSASSSSPFNNNGREVIAAFDRKYGIDTSRLSSLSQNNFDVKKLS